MEGLMRLNINDSDQLESPSEADLRKHVEQLGSEQFLVLSVREGCFVQTYHHGNGKFELEYRHGSEREHYKVDSALITGADVIKAFGLFLTRSPELETAWDWQPLELATDASSVDDGIVPDTDNFVEYNGVLMPSDWPKEIEEAQEIKGYMMHATAWDRIAHSGGNGEGEQGSVCQECGVTMGQLHVPGCPQEHCPRCSGVLVECGCEIDVD